jgi:hypothetical protein
VEPPVANGPRSPEPQAGGGRVSTRGYTVLGWAVWQIASRVAKRKVQKNRVKLGAAGVVALVLVAGLAAAKSGSDDE